MVFDFSSTNDSATGALAGKRPLVPKLHLPTSRDAQVAYYSPVVDYADYWNHSDFEEPVLATARIGTARNIDPSLQMVFTARIGTPHKGEASVQIYSVRTPSSPCRMVQAVAEKEADSFVPFWPSGSPPTTLELSGIPPNITAKALMAQLDALGFSGRYDFVNVGCAGSNLLPAGTAIINAMEYSDGCALAGRLRNFSDWQRGAATGQGWNVRKHCQVSWSLGCQGLEALIVQYLQHNDVPIAPAEGAFAGVPWVLTEAGWGPLLHPAQQGASACPSYQMAWGMVMFGLLANYKAAEKQLSAAVPLP